MNVRIFDRYGFEVPERQMIWADRVAIAFWLLTGGLIGAVYAMWGMPGYFVGFEQVAGVSTVAIWFACRVIDFAFTGRIR